MKGKQLQDLKDWIRINRADIRSWPKHMPMNIIPDDIVGDQHVALSILLVITGKMDAQLVYTEGMTDPMLMMGGIKIGRVHSDNDYYTIPLIVLMRQQFDAHPLSLLTMKDFADTVIKSSGLD